jgi:hypothetical protein
MQAVCDVLEQLLADGTLKHYAIGGATAAGFHGEPLATRAIDVFVYLEPKPGSLLVTLDALFTRLREMGFSQFEEEGLLIHDYPVQFLSASPGLETEAVQSAALVEWGSHRMRVMSPEHLAALAIITGRSKDRARLVYLTELPDFDRPRFQKILQTYHLLEKWRDWASGLGLDADL